MWTREEFPTVESTLDWLVRSKRRPQEAPPSRPDRKLLLSSFRPHASTPRRSSPWVWFQRRES